MSRGFTLVELITVMMVLAILSVGTVQFITDSSSGFAAAVTRAELAGDARFAVERVAREVRDALPNSVRVTGGCLEYVPVLGASRYVTLPVSSAATSFRAHPVEPWPVPAGARAAVFPDSAIYDLTSPASVSPTVTVSVPDASNEATVTMASAHQFALESPTNRFFLVDTPVSVCVDGGRLWRYTDYGFSSTQPTVAGLPAGLPSRALLAQEIVSTTPFSINAPTLTRNAVVGIDLQFARGGDQVRIEHLVQVRNVP